MEGDEACAAGAGAQQEGAGVQQEGAGVQQELVVVVVVGRAQQSVEVLIVVCLASEVGPYRAHGAVQSLCTRADPCAHVRPRRRVAPRPASAATASAQLAGAGTGSGGV